MLRIEKGDIISLPKKNKKNLHLREAERRRHWDAIVRKLMHHMMCLLNSLKKYLPYLNIFSVNINII
jgi:hypothetical protein